MDYFFNHQKLYILRKYTSEMTQAQIAEKLGMSRSNYSYLETGKIDMKINIFCELCRILECGPIFLLTKA